MNANNNNGDLISQLRNGTADGRARRVSLSAVSRPPLHPTSLVDYRSKGQLLITDRFRSVGDEARAVELAKPLSDRLSCTVLLSGVAPETNTRQIETGKEKTSIVLATGELIELAGHLGVFTAKVQAPEREVDLAERLGLRQFDLVLDLAVPGHLRQEVLPPGYFAPGEDTETLERALQELPELVGEFEKPKFFNYDPDICVHGGSGLTGCTRCLEACPTDAITSIGDKIEVNPYLCQGGGSCATACPTGAITYAYPRVSDLLEGLRATLKAYRDAGGRQPAVLLHDAEAGRGILERIAGNIPENVLPLEVEEVGAVGMDAWLAALAYGASHVALLAPPSVPPSVRGELAAQLEFAAAILDGMGHSRERLQLLSVSEGGDLLDALQALPQQPDIRPAGFAGVDEKRTTIRLAVDHLYDQAPAPTAVAALPTGAPFGEVQVDRQGCTLCMACVSVCPHSALSDAGDVPRLLFDEWNCVQCGLCETACPESVMSRHPRFVYDPEARRSTRALNEEEPFCCVVCGKPFATQSMMKTMEEKLKGHWMFQKPEALRRIQMCEDCRVKDMFMQEGDTIDVHKGPGH
ncbi:MAG: 4Fe-4S binding protein [Acidiferrobacterales bacterium]